MTRSTTKFGGMWDLVTIKGYACRGCNATLRRIREITDDGALASLGIDSEENVSTSCAGFIAKTHFCGEISK
jgi:hypothetical protein